MLPHSLEKGLALRSQGIQVAPGPHEFVDETAEVRRRHVLVSLAQNVIIGIGPVIRAQIQKAPGRGCARPILIYWRALGSVF